MPALDNLERVAARVRWQLRWKTTVDITHPRFDVVELDIFDGKRMVTRAGPIVVAIADVDRERGQQRARETIAGVVLGQLPEGFGASR